MRVAGTVIGFVLAAFPPAPAVVLALDVPVEVGGGGGRARDCLATFWANANRPSRRPQRVHCADGDPACDADATVDGVCTFAVTVCANSTFEPARCSAAGVDALTVLHSIDDGTDRDFDPDFQALQAAIDAGIPLPTSAADTCTLAPTSVRVPIDGPVRNRCRARTKQIRLVATPQDGLREDKDRLRLTCLPAPDGAGGCDPITLFDGTFDRIESQVFSQSCATGTCHDSQSVSGGLILEQGSAFVNIVGVSPLNFAAQNRGWLRILPGDPANSFLYRKITNDLLGDDALGERMPRPPRRRRVHPDLQEVIRAWIDAGAPETGWVPGTF